MNATDMARILGGRGGRARARRLSGEEKRRIASLGGTARGRSLQAARQIEENLRYAAAADALRRGRARVASVRRCSGPLPGLYPDGR